MSIPQPPKPLGQHCSALYNSTLYTYTQNGFFALPLEHGASWSQLADGVVADGAACVLAGQGTADEALYVVGGSVSSSKDVPANYAGLQRYRFAANQWDILPKQDQVLMNLTNHGVTYLQDSQQLMVYSGTKWPDVNTPSSQLFLVSTQQPYGTTSEPTGLAPPLLRPLVMPWGTSGGIIMGGDVSDKQFYTFNPTSGWAILPETLPAGLPDRSVADAAVVTDSDGSRRLIAFDFARSPTEVSQMLLSGTGSVPTYNSTLAPATTRTDFAMASDDKWIVVSGGNTADPLCIFNYQESTWLNTTSLLEKEQQPLVVSTSSSSSSSSTATSAHSTPLTSTSATATNAPASAVTSVAPDSTANVTPSTSKPTTQLLFIILGVVLLAALILGVAYLAMRYRRKKQPAEDRESRTGSRGTKREGQKSPRDSILSIQDRGVSDTYTNGDTKRSMSSKNSNRWVRREKEAAFTDVSTLPRGAVVGPAVGTNLELDERDRGWSRYFSGNSASNLVNGQPRVSRSISNASKSTYSMSSIPDEFDSRRLSNPSIGVVRSSTATSSIAGFSQILPTPVMANLHHDFPINPLPKPTAAALPPPRIGSAMTMDSNTQSSLFEGEPFWNPEYDSSSKGVKQSNGLWDAPNNTNPLWNAPESDDDTQLPIMNHRGEQRGSAVTVFPGGEQRGSALSVFPGGEQRSSGMTMFPSGERDSNVPRHTNPLWNALESDDHSNTRLPIMNHHDEQRGSALTVFPGGERSSGMTVFPSDERDSNVPKRSNPLWDAPESDDDSHIPSFYGSSEQRGSAMTVFPSGRDSARSESLGFESGSDAESNRAPTAAPRGNQDLGWFTR